MSKIRGITGNLIVRATIVAGVLDILSAFAYAMLEGRNPLTVLVGVACAVWPDARHAGVTGVVVGLLLHFSIMLVMASVFVMSARRIDWIVTRPFVSGSLYGLVLWAVMNLVVLPLRWPALFPHFTAITITEQLFSHIVLVGLPMAWMVRKPALALHARSAGQTFNPGEIVPEKLKTRFP